MPPNPTERPAPINYVFVDYENVHQVDLTIIGSKAVNFMLLMGPRQTKLDASLVEKLLAHTASVQLVRLTASGKNALDFTLAYYIGRAVAADSTGYFHIVSKDAGYDPLIQHLVNKHVHIRRHESFATLAFGKPNKSLPPAVTPKIKSSTKLKVSIPTLNDRAAQVLEHLRKPTGTRPKTQTKLVKHVVTLLGHKISDGEAMAIIENFRTVGYLAVGEKGVVTYNLK